MSVMVCGSVADDGTDGNTHEAVTDGADLLADDGRHGWAFTFHLLGFVK